MDAPHPRDESVERANLLFHSNLNSNDLPDADARGLITSHAATTPGRYYARKERSRNGDSSYDAVIAQMTNARQGQDRRGGNDVENPLLDDDGSKSLMLIYVSLVVVFLLAREVRQRGAWSEKVHRQHQHDGKPGIQVMNAILANMWPSMGKEILQDMRSNPVLVDPYLLGLNGGKLRYPPRIRNIKPINLQIPERSNVLAKEDPLVPPRFECEIEYKGRPDLEFYLTGADKHNHQILASFFKKAVRRLVPDIQIDVKSIDLHARLEVELDMHEKKVAFFFLERPHVQWDLEFTLTKAGIPFLGEDKLDTLLTNILANINQKRPICVNF